MTNPSIAHHEFTPSQNPGNEHACVTCGAPAGSDAHITPIEMGDSDEPSWLRDVREQIADAPSHGALNVLISGLMRWPEERKILIRPLITARRAGLDQPAAPVPPMPALNSMAQAPAAPAALLAPTTEQASAAPAPEGGPMFASWRQINIAGPYSGQWGAAVDHTQHGIAIEPPTVGDVVLVTRAKDNRSQPKRIAAVLESKTGSRGAYSICAVADPAPGARATIARPVAAATPTVTTPAPALPASAALASLATIDADLAAELGAAAAESAANAGVADLGAQLATGETSTAARRLGVGFSTVGQYIEALRRGGLQAHTRAEYLATVRRMGGTIDESAIPAANAAIVESAAPATVRDHRVNGRSLFDRPAADRGFKVGKAASEVKRAALLRSSDLIGWLGDGEAGGDFSWAGQSEVKRAALLTVLTAIGREADAPGAKNARAQAGRAVGKLGNQGYDVHAVQGDERRQLPPTVAHRWMVGRVNATGALTGATPDADIAYGQRVLVVDLHRDDTLHFDRVSTLATEVKTDYETRCAADTYISADLTAWLQRTLRDAHGATRFGVGWYVPAGQRRAAEQLTRAVSKVWGASWRHGMPVVACSHLFEGLIEGLSDEIVKLEEAWSGAQEEARAARRAHVTGTKAAGLLRQVFEAHERVRGYAVLLTGDGADEATVIAVDALKARLALLDGAIRPLTDDTSVRGSMLEFS